MTVLKNSAYKIQVDVVENTTGLDPEPGAVILDLSTGEYKVGTGTAWMRINAVPYADTYWLDMLGPLIGQRLDASATRYSADPYNGAIKFNADARYPNEVISQHVQIQHYWKLETAGRPHLHWKQQSANIPNFLLGYKIDENNELGSIDTDYSNFTFVKLTGHEFTYTSGVLNQISRFPDIDLTGKNISDMITFALFRDTTNASGLFAGVDPEPLATYAMDLDTHIQVDSPGSDFEYIKY